MSGPGENHLQPDPGKWDAHVSRRYIRMASRPVETAVQTAVLAAAAVQVRALMRVVPADWR